MCGVSVINRYIEDMAQEVFVQVFKAISQFRGDSKLSTWVYRIAVNLCKNRVKYLARRYADRIVALRAGRVVFDGTPEQLTAEIIDDVYGNVRSSHDSPTRLL